MWQKIEYYESFIGKFETSVFYFPEIVNGKYTIPETIQPKRIYGDRFCTHFYIVGTP